VKIGNANTKDLHRNVEVFYIVIAGNRCPVHLFPVAVSGECPRRTLASLHHFFHIEKGNLNTKVLSQNA